MSYPVKIMPEHKPGNRMHQIRTYEKNKQKYDAYNQIQPPVSIFKIQQKEIKSRYQDEIR
jgi:hypothetical protein